MAISMVILGGHGDGLILAEAIYNIEMTGGSIKLEGFLNDHVAKGTRIGEVAVLGSWDDWHLLPANVMFVPAIHKVGQMVERSARMRTLAIPDDRLATIIHTTACVARSVSIAPGCFIASNVTVQPGAKIRRCVSIRAGANIGHDAELHDFAYMGPNSTLCGRAVLEEGAHLAGNAAVMEDRRVGRYAIVGLASAVLRNIDEFTTVVGNPARPLSIASLRGDHVA
jgi:sugar O-acyltransferase (sialic acid O-acetyltransferase NeuD family)